MTNASNPKDLQDLIDQALRELGEERERSSPRPEVLKALGESVAEYEALYRALAK